MSKKKEISFLVILVFLFFIINYPFLDSALENFLIDYQKAKVQRIIDGDTIVTNLGNVRLLGINAPERSEQYHQEAKDFLENLVLNKTIYLEFGKDKKDKYNRLLAYIISENKNINLELVKNGYANYYFPSGKDIYYSKFSEAWNQCIQENKNLCRASELKCSECIELKGFNHNEQKIIFFNSCDFSCDLNGWKIHDEGRKRFTFNDFILGKNSEVVIEVSSGVDSKEKLFWENEDYVWTSSGDTLFLRDNYGGLVLWQSY